jgi:hypothetical protein
MDSARDKRPVFVIALLISAMLLSTAATYAQVNYLGIHFLRVQQEKVHLQMLQGTAGNPWQYRILADAMIEPLIKLSKGLGIPQPESFSFISFRFLQCLFILIAAGLYYRKLGLPIHENLIGLSMLTWSMSCSLYNSDLSFNVYFDIAFYLLAAILILEKKLVWLTLLMIPAALNRETSILIPFMLLFAFRFNASEKDKPGPATIAASLGLVVFAIVFAGLRLYYGKQPFLTADGYYPGAGLLVLNLSRWVTWGQILITLGIIPILAFFAYRNWPQTLRIFFWVVVPIWIAVHFAGALVAETRLLLVPQALIFIPGALFGLVGAHKLQT